MRQGSVVINSAYEQDSSTCVAPLIGYEQGFRPKLSKWPYYQLTKDRSRINDAPFGKFTAVAWYGVMLLDSFNRSFFELFGGFN